MRQQINSITDNRKGEGMNKKNSYVLELQEIGSAQVAKVGGKGANLGELFRIAGRDSSQIQVPDGFCVTTEAFKEVTEKNKEFGSLLVQLTTLSVDDRKRISETSARIRDVIEGVVIPDSIADEITQHIVKFGEENTFAVRSSATAEDLPSTSFAGQQDTYLNISGRKAILQHVSKCWASLFTERAVIYRMKNGFDHRQVYLSVVVQKLIFPRAAGILFTADPITGNRKILSIEASPGLGEALVSGLVNPDVYKVRNGEIIDKTISTKRLAIYASKDGGTKEQKIEPGKQNIQTLTDEEILQLESIGRKIEKHFGQPQDIEWCLADDGANSSQIYVVQSRPITTLFPIPRRITMWDQAELNDQENHIYLSVGHQQMMTDPIKPLGLSFYNLITNATMRVSAGRLFADVTPMLATPARHMVIERLGKFDPLVKDALLTIVGREDFIKPIPVENNVSGTGSGKANSPFSATVASDPLDTGNDPAIAASCISRYQNALQALKQDIQSKSGTDLLDFIVENTQELKKLIADPQSMGIIFRTIDAAIWINEKMKAWLDETNAADVLAQSVPNNITSEMGLALLDVADVIRPYAEVIDYLQNLQNDNNNFLNDLVKLKGGQEAKDAINAYLNKYGMRCVGEIDITKTRWSERPITLVPIILSNIKNFEPGASQRRFDQGRRESLKKEKELLDRLKELPDGEEKVKETKRMIDQVRNFSGYREYPKYGIVSRYFVYKQALLKEAERLTQRQVIHEKEDIYYLTFEELREVVRTNELDYQIIGKRKDAYKNYEKITPPRVITSDGEIVTGKYNRDNVPAGALVGLPVSAGVMEGRARVILKMEDANLETGDILITSFTDPSWTPLFVSAKGLVTEVGGLMTHGAVIAREYGLPAVVGVENATKLIKDGQQIRVHGTEGYVEIL
ncbi:phosphoenolpyruvate synthase [Chryseolinea sp. H1M3-3]|uniref:phosphoenolpyruvate synthase n=1 Tax=Chryseolinea sp. H1M3-3 TaxID=3034144 RepID=UPI0023EC83F6|nr:phosphoenolpyruvate synthase [Chryseolinea sp. H1M3-3]